MDVNKYQEWMKHLPSSVTNLPITKLIIPGSHNSCTSTINSTCQISPDADPQWHRIGRIFGRIGRTIIAKWSQTQIINIQEQLQLGIRYFDLRVCPRATVQQNGDESQLSHRDFQFVHGLYAGPVINELKTISLFLQQHSSEIVLLDFNHFYNMTKADHEELVQNLQFIFKDLIYNHDPYCLPPSLDQLRQCGKQLFIFYHNEIVTSYDILWPGKYMQSYWPNTMDPNRLVEYLTDRHNSCVNKQELECKTLPYFRVFQGILTPDAKCVTRHLFSGLKHALVNKINPVYLNWLETISQSNSGHALNVCLIDFVDMNYIEIVTQLNYHIAPHV